MRKFWIFGICLGFLTLLHGFELTQDSLAQLPRIGLALSGGGAKGFAQLGVLQVMDEHQVPITHIGGTSIGALIGGLYASGYSPQEIESIFREVNWQQLLQEPINRKNSYLMRKRHADNRAVTFRFKDWRLDFPSSLVSGKEIRKMLQHHTLRPCYLAQNDFRRLKIPFFAVSTDLLSGNPHTFHEGTLHLALRASISLPIMFQPVAYQSELLVDGGVVDNLPIQKLKAEKDVDQILAISVHDSLFTQAKDIASFFDVANQSLTIMMNREAFRQLDDADLFLAPPLNGATTTDFQRFEELLSNGRIYGKKHLDEILQLAFPTYSQQESFFFHHIEIACLDSIYYPVLQSLLRLEPATYYSEVDLLQALIRVRNSGFFPYFHLYTSQDQQVLFIEAQTGQPISSIEITGNSLFSTIALEDLLPPSSYRNFSNGSLNMIQESLLFLYLEAGYSLTQTQIDTLSASSIRIRIIEPKIQKISLVGNELTHGFVIRREISTQINKCFNQRKIEADVAALEGTGLFETVFYDVIPHPQGTEIVFHFQEKSAGILAASFNYQTWQSASFRLDVGHENLFGSGATSLISTQFGSDFHVDIFTFYEPIFKSQLSFFNDVFFRQFSRPVFNDFELVDDYDFQQFGFRLALGGISQNKSVNTYVESFALQTQQNQSHEFGKLSQKRLLYGYALRYLKDTRDRATIPHHGEMVQVAYEQFFQDEASEESFLFDRLSVAFEQACSLNRPLSAWTKGAVIASSTAPIPSYLYLYNRDFLHVPGLIDDQLSGKDFMFWQNGIRYLLRRFPSDPRQDLTLGISYSIASTKPITTLRDVAYFVQHSPLQSIQIQLAQASIIGFMQANYEYNFQQKEHRVFINIGQANDQLLKYFY